MPRGTIGSIACGHPLAARVGTDSLVSGGNAVDAAIAAAYALMVVLPEACGIGGDAIFLVSAPEGTRAFNGTGLSPQGFSAPLAADGAATATVPGAVAALELAGQRFGRATREENLAPAIALARHGFPVTEYLLGAIARQRPRLERGAPGCELLDPNLRAGSVLRLPALASTLEAISVAGPKAFYVGEVAAAVESTALSEGSSLSALDLAAHETVELPALLVQRHGASVWASPPASQAVLALMALGVLDQESSKAPTVRTHMAVEAIEAAFAFRADIASPDGVERLLEEVLGVDAERAQRRGGPTQQTHTTTVTSADRDGMVVSMVISLYDEFGCATLVPEFGFFLNNRMLGFDEANDSPNRARPSARPIHTLSPVIVEDATRRFAVATPGADGQVQTVTQVLDSILGDRMSLTAAVDRPRWRSSDASLIVEGGFAGDVAEGLRGLGHQLDWRPGRDKSFGAVVIAGVEKGCETTFAVADMRREAAASVC